jgi:hypothetical protein
MSEIVISNEAKELAEILMIHISMKERELIYVSLPIETIDGVYVNFVIRTYDAESGKLGLKYEIDIEVYDDDCNNITMYKHRSLPTEKITREYCENFCNSIFKALPLLKLNVNGEFQIHKKSLDIAIEKMDNLFKNFDCDNIKKSPLGECCVCYNRTNTKTDCKHSLCYRCWSKMLFDKDDDEEYVKCPMCRQCL